MLILLLLAIAIRFYPMERIPKNSFLWHIRSGQWLEVSMETNARMMIREARVYLPIGLDIQPYDAK